MEPAGPRVQAQKMEEALMICGLPASACRVHDDLGRAGERREARQRHLGGGGRQGQARLRWPPARQGGDDGGERGPAGRHLRRRRQDGGRPARHGQPWLRLHPEVSSH